MNDSVVFSVRAKFADDLGELVECPVCFNRPAGTVRMCVGGHHLCEKCRLQLIECPICKQPFSKVRNYIAEGLCSKLPEIISALLEPEVPESIIRCQIGFCQVRLPVNSMYHHIRDNHVNSLAKMKVTGCSSRGYVSLDLKYDFDKFYNYAIHAKGHGLLGFVKLHIDSDGCIFVIFNACCDDIEGRTYKIYLNLPRAERLTLFSTGKCSLTNQSLHDCQLCDRFLRHYCRKDLTTLRCTDAFNVLLDIALPRAFQ